jgi:N-acetylneuraminic acid mutarotase
MAVDSGTPSPRAYHASVWTGTEMIVWGGRVTTQSTYSKTGGRYDPQSDTWTATRADSTAPSERWRHTMVWTGTEAIVWGGAGPPNDCAQPKRWNNGGHYNPETDTWTSTTGPSVSPPLQGRTDHSAVWTGSEMIVWGGETLDTSGCLIVEQVYLRTGARYNPATKQWVATRYDTTTPTERALHTAVWTGALMIIWGGSTDGFRPNAPGGGQYDPITDTWIPMAFVTPSTRLGHSAVSTGTEMIIWGGSDNSGARYCPCSGSVYFGDSDGDGYGDPTTQVLSCTQPPGYVVNGDDCSDGNGAAWSVPSEARDLVLLDSASLEWSPPLAPGGTALVYDVLRSTIPSDFMDAAACIASDSIATTAFDASVPPEGSAYFYLVRAANDCPGGESPTGTDSEGQPIAGRSCP